MKIEGYRIWFLPFFGVDFWGIFDLSRSLFISNYVLIRFPFPRTVNGKAYSILSREQGVR